LPQFPNLTAEQQLVGEYAVVFSNLWLGVQVDHFCRHGHPPEIAGAHRGAAAPLFRR
jgi:hypothetical protein